MLEVLLKEAVSINNIDDAMDNHKRIIINYHSKGEDVATGARVIEVYAYGLTKAGNPVIRAFQPFGDTTSKVPSWKFFRLDRISAWKDTGQTFSEPASDVYKGLGEFNPNDDKTMSVVYKIATFGDDTTPPELPSGIADKTNPKMKSDSEKVYKTDTERRMERLKQQMANPIKLSDIKTKNGFKNYSDDTKQKQQQTTGPKMKSPEQIKQQDAEMSRLSKKLGDTSNRISFGDLNRRLSQPDEEQPTATQQQPQQKPELYKTDTERGLDNLRKQLENPKKIDLAKIPKR